MINARFAAATAHLTASLMTADLPAPHHRAKSAPTDMKAADREASIEAASVIEAGNATAPQQDAPDAAPDTGSGSLSHSAPAGEISDDRTPQEEAALCAEAAALPQGPGQEGTGEGQAARRTAVLEQRLVRLEARIGALVAQLGTRPDPERFVFSRPEAVQR